MPHASTSKAIQEGTVKPILVRDARAIKLIQERAITDNRSLSNAAAQVVLEALDTSLRQDVKGSSNAQAVQANQ